VQEALVFRKTFQLSPTIVLLFISTNEGLSDKNARIKTFTKIITVKCHSTSSNSNDISKLSCKH